MRAVPPKNPKGSVGSSQWCPGCHHLCEASVRPLRLRKWWDKANLSPPLFNFLKFGNLYTSETVKAALNIIKENIEILCSEMTKNPLMKFLYGWRKKFKFTFLKYLKVTIKMHKIRFFFTDLEKIWKAKILKFQFSTSFIIWEKSRGWAQSNIQKSQYLVFLWIVKIIGSLT